MKYQSLLLISLTLLLVGCSQSDDSGNSNEELIETNSNQEVEVPDISKGGSVTLTRNPEFTQAEFLQRLLDEGYLEGAVEDHVEEISVTLYNADDMTNYNITQCKQQLKDVRTKHKLDPYSARDDQEFNEGIYFTDDFTSEVFFALIHEDPKYYCLRDYRWKLSEPNDRAAAWVNWSSEKPNDTYREVQLEEYLNDMVDKELVTTCISHKDLIPAQPGIASCTLQDVAEEELIKLIEVEQDILDFKLNVATTKEIEITGDPATEAALIQLYPEVLTASPSTLTID